MEQLGIVVITSDPRFLGAVSSALREVHEISVMSDLPAPSASATEDVVFSSAAGKARNFLRRLKAPVGIHVIQAASWAESLEKIALHPVIVGACIADVPAESGAAEAAEWITALADKGVLTRFSGTSFALYSRDYPRAEAYYAPRPDLLIRALPADPGKLRLEVLSFVFNYLEQTFTNRLRTRQLRQDAPVTLGVEIARFLEDRVKSKWVLYYYTGSVVSSLIGDLQDLAESQGALCLRGPSEHSLACGALANWQLHGHSFVIVVTSGMIDEFKGTLANLRQARARGFIICAENRPGQWFPFQGTISSEEDSRAVLKARGIPHVFLSEPDGLEAQLAEAFRLYEEDQGPVVLLATPQVLESKHKLAQAVALPPRQERAAVAPGARETGHLDRAMDVLNRQAIRVLWQCGNISPHERDLVLSIAERAGIALADTIDRPGSISAYLDGTRNPNYLGSCGVYGFSRKLYEFLHERGELRPREQQCLFFLKSKIAQVATPFNEGVLQRRMQIVQVNREPGHLSPFADIPLPMPLVEFLKHVDARLDVDPGVLESRRRWIRESSVESPDILGGTESVPMSPNYFFRQLNLLTEELIQKRSYSFTGIYDVGRCGVSAIRNVVRTGPGFSGWYGRALMGDAYQAALFLAFTTPGNLVAFVGDGAKNLVPCILPGLLENSLDGTRPLAGNLTVFFCLNGAHSIISTYQERFKHRPGGRQMSVVNVLEPEREFQAGRFRVSYRNLHSFDRNLLEESLTARSRVNFFNVFLSHDSFADGLNLISEEDWQVRSDG